MPNSLVLYCLILLAATSFAGVMALIRPWSDRLLHHFIAFGAGIFLGAVFFELLPEATASGAANPGLPILLGYMIIFGIERVILGGRKDDERHSHAATSLAAFIGLSVHSLADGFGLAVATPDPHLGPIMFASILAHQVPAGFALGSLLVLARFTKPRIIILIALFAAMPPLGAVLLSPLLGHAESASFQTILGFVTGTFLYVATADLLPEAFHDRARRYLNLAVLIVGIAAMALLGSALEHVHLPE